MPSDKLRRQLNGVRDDVRAIGKMLQYESSASNIREYDRHADYLLANGLSSEEVVEHCVQYMGEMAEGRYFAEDSLREARPQEKFEQERQLIEEDIRQDEVGRTYQHLDLVTTAYDRFLAQYAD